MACFRVLLVYHLRVVYRIGFNCSPFAYYFNLLLRFGVLVYICIYNSNKTDMDTNQIKGKVTNYNYPDSFTKWGMPFKKLYESEIGCIYEQVIGNFRGQDILRYECFLHRGGTYPKTTLWGFTAWTCVTYELALKKITFEYNNRLKVDLSGLDLDEGDEEDEDVELED